MVQASSRSRPLLTPSRPIPDGKPIASQIVLLGDHPVSHTLCAAIDPQLRQMGAAAFLRWRGFELLCRLGKTANDLTDAALNSVGHFKSQFGKLVTSMVVETKGTIGWRPRTVLSHSYARSRELAAGTVRRIRTHDSP